MPFANVMGCPKLVGSLLRFCLKGPQKHKTTALFLYVFVIPPMSGQKIMVCTGSHGSMCSPVYGPAQGARGPTHRQTNKQASEQTQKHHKNKTHNQPAIQPAKETNKQASKQASKQTNKQTNNDRVLRGRGQGGRGRGQIDQITVFCPMSLV